jgi:C4-dicarboxylate-specific signal transduction histidine kinase
MGAREIAFMGQVTAGVTHEIKNVLAIIKESSALLQDIIDLGKGDAVPKTEQIEKVVSRIQKQVARGNTQLTSLNWLAHTLSDGVSSIEINDMSSEVVNLMQRLARLKRVELEFQAMDRDVMIHTDVARLLVILAACIEYFLNREPPKSRVLLRLGEARDEVMLGIFTGSMDGSKTVTETEAGGDPLPSELAELEPLLGPLGGRLAFTDAGEGAQLHLILSSRGDDLRQER